MPMPTKLTSFRVLGLHPVQPTQALFQETLEIQWGADLFGTELERARAHVQEHFAGLYLIAVEIDPPDAEIEWGEITQPAENLPKSNWQVPYDEQPVDRAAGRWVFFMHFVNPSQLLQTPIGPVPVPAPSARPPDLAAIEYEAP